MALLAGLVSCTSKLDERIPSQNTMHFPLMMAKNNKYLAVTSTSSDGKYDFGRLVILDTDKISQITRSQEPKFPMVWEKVVLNNLLIPKDVSGISFTDNSLTFADRENNELLSLPVARHNISCNAPDKRAEQCHGARLLKLSDYDPFSISTISEQPSSELILASYLSSDRIDMIETKKNTADPISIRKSFKVKDWVNSKIHREKNDQRRYITKKIYITNKSDQSRSKAYFLVEQHLNKASLYSNPKASFLISIKVTDLINQATIDKSTIELSDLREQFGIAGSQDLYVDETTEQAYILAKTPEILVKIDLSTNSLIESVMVCRGATSMTVGSNNLWVPCIEDDRIAMYARSPLDIITSSRIVARGPAFIVYDEPNHLLYCSFTYDGIVGVFNDQLEYLGHIFDKAPSNSLGS